MSWSWAVLSAMLKLSRSGSISGRASTASLIGDPQRLVGDQQCVDLLRYPGGVRARSTRPAHDGRLELEVRGLDLPTLVVERHDLLGRAGRVTHVVNR
jgi:hypothetical protein